jgi:hypothetical protein
LCCSQSAPGHGKSTVMRGVACAAVGSGSLEGGTRLLTGYFMAMPGKERAPFLELVRTVLKANNISDRLDNELSIEKYLQTNRVCPRVSRFSASVLLIRLC